MKVAVVTCRAYPGISSSDALYRDALEELGAQVRVVPWNDGAAADAAALAGMDAVVLRSPWDYPHDLAAFLAWIARLEEAGVRLLNRGPLVRWNVDKRYLLDLRDAGVGVPDMALLGPDADAGALRDALSALGVEDGAEAVLKPAWGGSGFAVALVSRAGAADALGRAKAEAPGRPLLVQRFLPEVAAEGEASFVFIGGRFAHAVRKRPADGEFRVNSRYGPRPPERFEPSPALLEDAQRVLSALPGGSPPLYARIDGVPGRDGRLACLEAEVVDPALFLDLAPETAAAFARATLEHAAGARLSAAPAPARAGR
jgi:glutathione synthase/RimK-type ligase-like ATP-grasp enzyme